jgi:hypothetical protein
VPDDGWVEDPAAADVWERAVGEGGVEKIRRNNFLAGEGGVAVCEDAFPASGSRECCRQVGEYPRPWMARGSGLDVVLLLWWRRSK